MDMNTRYGIVDSMMAAGARVTKEDCVITLGLDAFTFDYALPQTWVDEHFTDEQRQAAVGSFVWLYDGKAKLFGRPFPITSEGRKLFKKEFKSLPFDPEV